MVNICPSLTSCQSPSIRQSVLPLLSLITAVAVIALAQTQFIPYPCTYAGATILGVTFILCSVKIALQLRKGNSLSGHEVVVSQKEVKETGSSLPVILSDELITAIFRNLSAPDLASASLVCRQWHKLTLVIPQLKTLDDNLLLCVFRFFDPTTLSRASLVCRKWRELADDPQLRPALLSAMNWYGVESSNLQALAAYNALGRHNNPRFMPEYLRHRFNFFSGNRWFNIEKKQEGVGVYQVAVHTFTSDCSNPKAEYFNFKLKDLFFFEAAVEGNVVYIYSCGYLYRFSLGNENPTHAVPCENTFGTNSLFVTKDEVMGLIVKPKRQGGSFLRSFSKDLSQQKTLDCPQLPDLDLTGALGYKDLLILLYTCDTKKRVRTKIIIWNRFEGAEEIIYDGSWVHNFCLSETTLILENLGFFSFYNLETKKWSRFNNSMALAGAAGGILFVHDHEWELKLCDFRHPRSEALISEIEAP